METQITFEDKVVTNGVTSSVKLQCNKFGCVIFFHDVVDNTYTSVSMVWDEMSDIEHISAAFGNTTVRMFRVICNLLDKAQSCRHAYI